MTTSPTPNLNVSISCWNMSHGQKKKKKKTFPNVTLNSPMKLPLCFNDEGNSSWIRHPVQSLLKINVFAAITLDQLKGIILVLMQRVIALQSPGILTSNTLTLSASSNAHTVGLEKQ